MDSEGEVLEAHQGPRDAGGFAKTAELAETFVALREKAKTGDKGARLELLIRDLHKGALAASEAEPRIEELGELDADGKARLGSALADAEVRESLRGVGREDKEALLAAGGKFLAMKKEGRIPDGDMFQTFWILMMDHAESGKDVATFEEALGALREKLGDLPQAKAFFDRKEAALKGLKEGGE